MPKYADIRKVMVIGSGPITIGQAAEFDYSGTQACRALREEGIEITLINSNPATIMTDTQIADRVYVEPLSLDFASKVIERERPDGLLPTLGGQTGLNLATQLAEQGVLDKYGVRLLGTPLATIRMAEDRREFRELMKSIGEPVPESWIVQSSEDLENLLKSDLPYPLIVRPAYTLGGTGGGIAHNAAELADICKKGMALSLRNQVMVERSLIGWKEIEYEVMRDSADNCITICNMENLDPMGIHTGDSIVVAPSQTLSDKEYQMLRSAALKIIRALGVEGGCNIQFALSPYSFEYYIIEVNPRVSRSSALASKATGYPIARVSAKVAIGLRLDEIPNAVTKETSACFEPALDYCVVKIPKWPFDKLATSYRVIGTQMKATGEVMAIDRNFEAALMKAIRSTETGAFGLINKRVKSLCTDDLLERIETPNDERLFAIAEAIRCGVSLEKIAQLSFIDPWFLRRIQRIVNMEFELQDNAEAIRQLSTNSQPSTVDLLRKAKTLGFPDKLIAQLIGSSEAEVRAIRKSVGINPTFKMVDTCAAEFEARTPYFYSCYEEENEALAYI
jgi:carbamoyl-phosphate synthase large subunit